MAKRQIRSLRNLSSPIMKDLQADAAANVEAAARKGKKLSSSVSSAASSALSALRGDDNKEDKWKVAASLSLPIDHESIAFLQRNVTRGQEVVELLRLAVDIASIILEIVNTLQSDVKNYYKPLKIVAEALLEQLKQVMVSIASTGVYVLPIIPAEMELTGVIGVKKGVPLSTSLRVAAEKVLASAKSGNPMSSFYSDFDRAAFTKTDPNRPIFNNEGDYVGGFVLFLDAATNAGDLIQDMQAFWKLTGNLMDMGTINVEPPDNFQAVATMAPKQGRTLLFNSDNLLGDITRSLLPGSNNYPAIRLSWKPDENKLGNSGWHLYRMTQPSPNIKLDDDGNTIKAADGKLVFDYTDPVFNDGNPVFVSNFSSKPTVEYYDFDVKEDTTYWYWVVPVFYSKANKKYIEGSKMSAAVSATAINCIPDDQAPPVVQTPEGFKPGKHPADPPYWRNLTARNIIGERLDKLYKSLYNTIQRLLKSAETSVYQQDELITLLQEKLEQLQLVLDQVQEVLATLQSLKFSGSALSLYLPPKEGGMKNFVRRLKAAKIPDDVAKDQEPAKQAEIPPKAKEIRKDLPPNADGLRKPKVGTCSIYAAVVVVCGWPGPDTFKDAAKSVADTAVQQAEATNLAPSMSVGASSARKAKANRMVENAFKDQKKWVMDMIMGLMK